MGAKELGPEELAEWRSILLQLKPRTLEIFILIAVDRLNSKQVGARLGLPAFWVRRHLLKAIIHIEDHAPIAFNGARKVQTTPDAG